ncbi:MAG: hypothetical protein ACXVI3_05750 [Halobacteriota archaeon]
MVEAPTNDDVRLCALESEIKNLQLLISQSCSEDTDQIEKESARVGI